MACTIPFIKYFFSQKKGKDHFINTALPLRAIYKVQEDLYDLGHDIASGKEILLPEYEGVEDFRKRLDENAKLILRAFHTCYIAAQNDETMAPSAQWLLDNHYTIDKTIQQLRCNLSKSFIKQLPLYKQRTDIPRIFALAWLYIAHTDSIFSQKHSRL